MEVLTTLSNSSLPTRDTCSVLLTNPVPGFGKSFYWDSVLLAQMVKHLDTLGVNSRKGSND